MHERKFDPAKRHMLNQEHRLQWLPPATIWDMIDHPEPELIVDIGAGTGYITEAFAEERPSAKIMALDIEPQMIREMHNNLKHNHRICPILMAPDTIPLPEDSVDVVWMVNLFHELDEPVNMLSEIKRTLKSGGKLLVIDWDKEAESFNEGPPQHHRLSMEAISEQIRTQNFRIESSRKLPNHTGVVASIS